MIIGNAERHRAFNRNYGKDLGLDYYFNNKSWIFKQLFYYWLCRFDLYIGCTSARKVLLLIQDCSTHGCKSLHSDIENVCIHCLPPNTSIKIQSLDVGIIAWVEANYKVRHFLRVFQNIESLKKSI